MEYINKAYAWFENQPNFVKFAVATGALITFALVVEGIRVLVA